ncbi:uncharacterized protein LOC122282367 [Carya illinoinensis]|uniref:uncharacterized protein LOC122282367 n=1 Tax=Carya illinoinensis TaxID=32201 RepID=UPI001C71E54B|nr:uncharacterized protein LOC122282367 [Carya illinoinensis]
MEKRKQCWQLLCLLRPDRNCPWLCMGDFNELLSNDEKMGGVDRPFFQMERFREALDECELGDLGFVGSRFTWCNKREGRSFIKERLDRVLGNTAWPNLFDTTMVHVLPVENSDHTPLLVSCFHHQEEHITKKKLFRYEAFWSKRQESKDIVHRAWTIGGGGQSRLQSWAKSSGGNHQQLVRQKRELLQHMQELNVGDINGQIKETQEEVDVLLEEEELKWRQRAKQQWLKGGDRNSKFFHKCATHRRKVNMIKRIIDERGVLATTQGAVSQVFQSYYQQLFTSSSLSSSEEVVQVVDKVITPEMNRQLMKRCSLEEVRLAVFDMNPHGSPGPDGFSACFYQDHWLEVGVEVTTTVQEIFATRSGLAEINDTHIALIPKKKIPTLVMEYRPISLCNVLYKVVSKVMANRLKQFLPSIVSSSQSAFVPGRLISNNIIVTYEAMHSMKNRMRGKREGYMALKLDMSKAYDRIEWDFLEAVLLKMGFSEEWTALVLQCVSTVNYSIMLNGRPLQKFHPMRGLRQGDPLSPYLFILCSEVLDDSLLFCKANALEWSRLCGILKDYENVSGQRLNMDKTTIYFSCNTRREAKEAILATASLVEAKSYEKYLGLPAYVGKQKLNAFKPVLDSIRARMQSWSVRFLSQAGKEVLLKSIVQAIPTYCMSIFKLPKAILNAINSLMQKFWWGMKGDRSKVKWIPWKSLGFSKDEGGLGYRDFEKFNVALLAKQGWKLLKHSDSLAAKVLKAKYFYRSDFMKAKVGSNSSYLWRSFIAGREVLSEGLFLCIGNGDSVRIWYDKWVPKPTSFKVQSARKILGEESKVSCLIDQQGGGWKLPLVQEVFDPEEAAVISQIPLSITNASDLLTWRCSSDGKFSVKSANHLLGTMELVIRANPPLLRILDSPLCPVCNQEPESVMHALWSCTLVQDVWGLSLRKLQKRLVMESSFKELWVHLLSVLEDDELDAFAATIFQIWKRRNNLVFENKFWDPGKLVGAARNAVSEFLSANETSTTIQAGINQSVHSWSPPPLYVFKANWDAAVDRGRSKIGVGVVIRDWEGRVVVSMSSPKNFFPDAHLAESYGALKAVLLCKQMGIKQVIFKGDAKQVVMDLTSSH